MLEMLSRWLIQQPAQPLSANAEVRYGSKVRVGAGSSSVRISDESGCAEGRST